MSEREVRRAAIDLSVLVGVRDGLNHLSNVSVGKFQVRSGPGPMPDLTKCLSVPEWLLRGVYILQKLVLPYSCDGAWGAITVQKAPCS
jgi:hypothetical protein